ncbi:MAG: hypothetical protein WAY02_13695, partial [Burkholderiaceae bacterium]
PQPSASSLMPLRHPPQTPGHQAGSVFGVRQADTQEQGSGALSAAASRRNCRPQADKGDSRGVECAAALLRLSSRARASETPADIRQRRDRDLASVATANRAWAGERAPNPPALPTP